MFTLHAPDGDVDRKTSDQIPIVQRLFPSIVVARTVPVLSYLEIVRALPRSKIELMFEYLSAIVGGTAKAHAHVSKCMSMKTCQYIEAIV
jgi:hypothetical protein